MSNFQCVKASIAIVQVIIGNDALEITHQHLIPHPPVIMITANYTNELRQKVREKGYSLLNKPVKPHKMKLALSNLLSNAKT